MAADDVVMKWLESMTKSELIKYAAHWHDTALEHERMYNEAKAENAKLREERDGWKKLCTDQEVMHIMHEETLDNENDKLRELCRRYGEYVSQDRCEGCVYKTRCNSGLIDECWQRGEICDLARELGIEVPE